MKKRLSFVPTLIIGLAVLFLIGTIAVWVIGKFNLPNWVTALFSMAGIYSFIEVIGRIGPQEIEPPSIRFMKLSAKDRTVLVVAGLAFLVLALPIGTGFASRWLNLLFIGLGFLVFWFICFFFGSKELMSRSPKDESHERRR